MFFSQKKSLFEKTTKDKISKTFNGKQLKVQKNDNLIKIGDERGDDLLLNCC